MKASLKFFLLTMAVTAVLSCAEDVDCLPVKTFHIQISPSVTSVRTKAPMSGNAFPTTMSFVMSAYHNASSGGTSGNYFSDVLFRYSDGVWKGGELWPADGTLDLFAYSADGIGVTPSYKSNVGQGVTLTVPDNSTGQVDILWASAKGQTCVAAGNALVFKHAQAAVAFVAKAGSAYDAASNTGVTITEITVNDVKCSGVVDLENTGSCTWSSLGTQKTLTLTGLSGGYDVPATPMTIDGSNPFGIGGAGLMLIPQNATSITVTYTAHDGRDSGGNPVDEAGQTVTIPLSGSWTAGKEHVYMIEFENKAVSATYNVSAKTGVTLPLATLSAGAIVSVDWGDGQIETYRTASSGQVTMAHTYSPAYSGTVNFTVHNGTIDFGEVAGDVFQLFKVNDTGHFLISVKKVSGNFTVNSSGKKVKFSPGNLYWDGSSFQFEKHQYDCPSGWDEKHIGHFSFSKDKAIAISLDYYDNYAVPDMLFASDGGAIKGWTTLSIDEWEYLETHALAKNTSGKLTITIDGKTCIVLKPDGFSGRVADTYTASEWDIAEASGLVALPSAGFRYNRDKTITFRGSEGVYWSGTPHETDWRWAYSLYFGSRWGKWESFYISDDEERSAHLAIRLVAVQ